MAARVAAARAPGHRVGLGAGHRRAVVDVVSDLAAWTHRRPVRRLRRLPGAASAALVVDVAGKVLRPGIYRLPAGSRVYDAIRAAGGPRPGVSTVSLNLAEPLHDGEQVVVGATGRRSGRCGSGARREPATSARRAPPTVDLNTATLEQLETLPGVGPVLGQHILDWRDAHGQFSYDRPVARGGGHRRGAVRRAAPAGDAVTADVRSALATAAALAGVGRCAWVALCCLWPLVVAGLASPSAALSPRCCGRVRRAGRRSVPALARQRGFCMALVLLPFAGRLWQARASPLTALADANTAVTADLTTSGDPHVLAATGVAGVARVAVPTDADAIDVGTHRWQVSGPVLVLAPAAAWRDVLPGQRVRLDGTLQPSLDAGSTGATMFAEQPPQLLGRPPWWQRAAGSVRSGLRDASSVLPIEERGLLPGLVDGDTSNLDPVLVERFRVAGLTHLVAVSADELLDRRRRGAARAAPGAGAAVAVRRARRGRAGRIRRGRPAVAERAAGGVDGGDRAGVTGDRAAAAGGAGAGGDRARAAGVGPAAGHRRRVRDVGAGDRGAAADRARMGDARCAAGGCRPGWPRRSRWPRPRTS